MADSLTSVGQGTIVELASEILYNPTQHDRLTPPTPKRRTGRPRASTQVFVLSVLPVDISVSLLLRSMSQKSQRAAQRELDWEENERTQREHDEEEKRAYRNCEWRVPWYDPD